MSGVCPNCDSLSPVNFVPWTQARQPEDERHRYVASFRSLGKLKFGERFVTPCCDSQWYLHHEHFMYLLSPGRRALLEAWASRDLSLPEEWRAVLRVIGAARSEYDSAPEYPCKIVLRDGTPVDHCVVLPQTLPPGFGWPSDAAGEHDFYYCDEIESLVESPHALSLAIRNALMELRASERSSQTLTIDNDAGVRLYVDSHSCFSPVEQDPGDPFRIAEDERRSAVGGVKGPRETRVIADPF